MTTLIITHAMLVQLGAPQCDSFKELFGDQVEVTEENVLRAIQANLDIGWFVRRVFSPLAIAEYERIEQPAWAEYERIRQPAWAEYERIKAHAFVVAYQLHLG